jgi:hypothetical protein
MCAALRPSPHSTMPGSPSRRRTFLPYPTGTDRTAGLWLLDRQCGNGVRSPHAGSRAARCRALFASLPEERLYLTGWVPRPILRRYLVPSTARSACPVSAFRFPLSAFRFPGTIVTCLLAFSSGCAELPSSPVVGDSDVVAVVAALESAGCSPGIFGSSFYGNPPDGWGCDAEVDFYSSDSDLALQLASAVDAWNSRLVETGFAELPEFRTTTEPALAKAIAVGTSLGSAFCGSWDQFKDTLTVSTACNGNTGTLYTLLLHEVGHAVGWVGSGVDKVTFGTSAASHCVMNLPSDLSINSTICVHEIEGVLAGFNLVAYDFNTFFSTPFVVGANPLLSQTLAIGDTTTLAPGALQLERGGVVPGTESAYTWTTSDSEVATVSSTGLVTATGSGNATIRATPVAGTGYLLAHPFRTAGQTATITVPAPPPIAPHILLDEVPVYNAGWHTFTYVRDGTPGTLYWTIDDSRTTTVNPDAFYTSPGWTLSVYIEPGSYTLTVSAWGVTQTFPVCTYGSEQLGVPVDGKAPPTTDAVEGCPPPSGPPEYE